MRFKEKNDLKIPVRGCGLFLVTALVCACVIFPCADSFAQEEVTAETSPSQEGLAAVSDTPANAGKEMAETAEEEKSDPGGLNPSDMASLFFTYWEHTAIIEAKKSRGSVRPPTQAELSRIPGVSDEGKVAPPPEERELRLGGIVYVTGNDWTVWLNGKRVTPDAIPEEVLDLRVYKEFIEIKWYDDWTSQIFPVRLKPHQRFNLDTRIFLPG